VIATDGYVSVEREAFTLIRQHLNDANVFAFGIGSSVNRHLIEGMARVGEGLPFVVLNPGEARSTADRFVHYIESPLLTHAEISTPGFDAYDLEPSKLPDLFAERPLVVVGKYRGQPAGSIVITGETGQGRFERRVAIGAVAPAAGNDAIKYLWARERVALLSDFAGLPGPGSDGRQEIVALGLKYNLLTEFTSFVAIDQRVRRTDGQLETVKQPLPLPQGVSDFAVGVGGTQMRAVAESVMVAAKAAPLMPGGATDNLAFLRSDARPQQAAGPVVPRVEVVENHLQTNAAVSRAELDSILGRALAGVNACAGSGAASGGRRLKIFFDGMGRASRVELAAPDSSKAAAAFLACVQNAVRQAALALPWPAGGYLIVRVL
jgi:Ca-activated chloride channel family protein